MYLTFVYLYMCTCGKSYLLAREITSVNSPMVTCPSSPFDVEMRARYYGKEEANVAFAWVRPIPKGQIGGR